LDYIHIFYNFKLKFLNVTVPSEEIISVTDANVSTTTADVRSFGDHGTAVTHCFEKKHDRGAVTRSAILRPAQPNPRIHPK
jgi:hypothetical protein